MVLQEGVVLQSGMSAHNLLAPMRYEQRVPCAWLLRHEQGSAGIVGASVIKAAGAVRDTFQSYLRTVHELLAPVAFQQHRARAWLVNHAM